MAGESTVSQASAEPVIPLPVECDRLRVTVIVDNSIDLQSTTPATVRSQTANLLLANPRWVASGGCLCCANWGLSLLIEIEESSGRRSILFDAGPDHATFLRNAVLLAAGMKSVEDIVLSHGHWDHAGGLIAAVALARTKGTDMPVSVHVNSDMFRRRGLRMPSGVVIPFRDVPSIHALRSNGARVVVDDQPRTVARGTALIGGAIPRSRPHEVGFPGHVSWNESNADWDDDPLIEDERWLAVRLRHKGVFVFSACSHAGIGNILAHVQQSFPRDRIYGLMGGLHLSGPSGEAAIDATVEDLATFNLQCIVPAHCTGWRAQMALSTAFGDSVIPAAVGQTFEFV